MGFLSIGDFLKTGPGSFVLSKLAKKIISSGKHSHDSSNAYNYRSSAYENIQGSYCINNVNYDGFSFGNFRCPVEGFDYSATMCCGDPYEQYCCSSAESEEFNRLKYGSAPNSYDQVYQGPLTSSFGIVLSVMISIILIGVIGCGIVAFCFFKKRVSVK
jgi:hypothetical protein